MKNTRATDEVKDNLCGFADSKQLWVWSEIAMRHADELDRLRAEVSRMYVRFQQSEAELATAQHSAARVEMINDLIMDDDRRDILLQAFFDSHDAHSFWHPIDEAIRALKREGGGNG